MPTNIKIIHAHDFIKVTADGALDFAETKKVLLQVAAVAGNLKDYEVILDARKAHSAMSFTDLWYLAAELSKLRTTFSCKTAVLCPRERFDHAGFFALCGQNLGLQVRAFTAYEDAIDWLVTDAAPLERAEAPPIVEQTG